jgi:uncharacterized membrane protein
MNRFRELILHRLFAAGIWVKGIDGILETIGGILFLLVNQATLSQLVLRLTRPELLEDPDDLVANWLRHSFARLPPSTKLFGSIYLLAHGLIKILLVAGLLREKLWSFPIATVVLCGFIGYQTYRLTLRYSAGLLFLTLLDAVIVGLIWREYRSVKRRA